MLNLHGITSARYSTENTAIDAPVTVTRNGVQESRRANDDIEGGGMLAYLAGGGLIHPYIPPAASVAEIKAEARRRILDRYPLWKQVNIIRSGDGLAAMTAFIDAVRAASNALEATLPSDYQADKHWPA